MKITFSYLPEEEPEAAADVAALRQLHPRMKVRKSNAHPPFKHIYLTIKKSIVFPHSFCRNIDLSLIHKTFVSFFVM